VDVEWDNQTAIPGADLHRGRAAASRHFEQWFDAWREIHYTATEVLDCGDCPPCGGFAVTARARPSGVEVTDRVLRGQANRLAGRLQKVGLQRG